MSGAGEEEPQPGGFFVTDEAPASPPSVPLPPAQAPPGPAFTASFAVTGYQDEARRGPAADLRESWLRRLWRRLRSAPPGPR